MMPAIADEELSLRNKDNPRRSPDHKTVTGHDLDLRLAVSAPPQDSVRASSSKSPSPQKVAALLQDVHSQALSACDKMVKLSPSNRDIHSSRPFTDVAPPSIREIYPGSSGLAPRNLLEPHSTADDSNHRIAEIPPVSKASPQKSSEPLSALVQGLTYQQPLNRPRQQAVVTVSEPPRRMNSLRSEDLASEAKSWDVSTNSRVHAISEGGSAPTGTPDLALAHLILLQQYHHQQQQQSKLEVEVQRQEGSFGSKITSDPGTRAWLFEQQAIAPSRPAQGKFAAAPADAPTAGFPESPDGGRSVSRPSGFRDQPLLRSDVALPQAATSSGRGTAATHEFPGLAMPGDLDVSMIQRMQSEASAGQLQLLQQGGAERPSSPVSPSSARNLSLLQQLQQQARPLMSNLSAPASLQGLKAEALLPFRDQLSRFLEANRIATPGSSGLRRTSSNTASNVSSGSTWASLSSDGAARLSPAPGPTLCPPQLTAAGRASPTAVTRNPFPLVRGDTFPSFDRRVQEHAHAGMNRVGAPGSIDPLLLARAGILQQHSLRRLESADGSSSAFGGLLPFPTPVSGNQAGADRSEATAGATPGMDTRWQGMPGDGGSGGGRGCSEAGGSGSNTGRAVLGKKGNSMSRLEEALRAKEIKAGKREREEDGLRRTGSGMSSASGGGGGEQAERGLFRPSKLSRVHNQWEEQAEGRLVKVEEEEEEDEEGWGEAGEGEGEGEWDAEEEERALAGLLSRKPGPKRKDGPVSAFCQNARKRRERISCHIKSLEKLVPRGSRSDAASVLEATISFVKQLIHEVKDLNTQLADAKSRLDGGFVGASIDRGSREASDALGAHKLGLETPDALALNEGEGNGFPSCKPRHSLFGNVSDLAG